MKSLERYHGPDSEEISVSQLSTVTRRNLRMKQNTGRSTARRACPSWKDNTNSSNQPKNVKGGTV